jgi:lipooligosaccharide transport system permease protein
MTLALRIVQHNALVYRRTWRGSVFSSFASPLLFLTAMGLGLGGLVNRSSGGVGGVTYLQFLAPGLLAAATMQTAAGETMFPIMAKIVWQRTYEGMLATPLTVRDLLVGEIGWLVVRLAMVAAIFFGVMALFGVPRSPEAALAVPAAVLNGLAFGAPILAFSATQRNAARFAVLQRFVLMPLFLFGGAFFPIEKLPTLVQGVAWLTPLSHGVALTRGLTLGTLTLGPGLVHVAVLLLFACAGTAAAAITLPRRLVT